MSVLDDAPRRLWIGGAWRDAADGATFAVVDPATEQPLASVADGTADDMLAAIAAAEAARHPWAARAPRERAEILRRVFERLLADAEPLAELIVRENGKALVEARSEVAYAAEFFRWYAEEAVRLEGRVVTAPSGARRRSPRSAWRPSSPRPAYLPAWSTSCPRAGTARASALPWPTPACAS